MVRGRRFAVLFACATLGLAAGCGDNPPVYSFIFSNVAAVEIPNAVALRYHDNGERKVTLAVVVQALDLAAVSGASFDVTFGPALLEFDRVRPGTFLETGGEVSYSAAPAPDDPGRVHIDIAQAAGADPQLGEGRLALLEFRALDEGETMVDFAAPELLGPPPETLPVGGLLWFGGLLTIY